MLRDRISNRWLASAGLAQRGDISPPDCETKHPHSSGMAAEYPRWRYQDSDTSNASTLAPVSGPRDAATENKLMAAMKNNVAITLMSNCYLKCFKNLRLTKTFDTHAHTHARARAHTR